MIQSYLRYFFIFSFFALFILIDTVVGGMLRPYHLAATAGVLQQYEVVRNFKDDPDILFTGDSHTQNGLDTGAFSDLCRCKVGNISMNGADMVTTYYLLQSYLAHNRTPKVAVIQINWSNLSYHPDGGYYTVLLEKLGPAEQWEYFRNSFDLNFVAKKFIRSFRYKKALSRLIKGDLAMQITEAPRNGFMPLEGTVRSIDSNYTALHKPGSIEVIQDHAQAYYAGLIITLLKKAGSEVVIVQPPEPLDWFGQIKNVQEVEDDILTSAKKHDVRFINFLLSSDMYLPNDTYFYDEKHLNREGARIYTDNLWYLVKQDLSQ